MFKDLYDKTIKLAGHKSSKSILAGVSFIESFIFPIPPDVLIIPMTIAKKNELKNSKDLPFEVETLENSQAFKDTTNMFEEPKNANKIINSFMSDQEIAALAREITNV